MLLLLLACQNQQEKLATSSEEFTYINEDVEHFSLFDENETSAFYGQEIATDQFPEMVSAWYFGHAT